MKSFSSVCCGILMLLTGCSSHKASDYADNTPVLDIRQFFNGKVQAAGIFMGRSGKTEFSFHADMRGSWKGDDGTFEEHFIYSDGRKQERTWTLHFTDDHHFIATAHDVIGTAKGEQYGNAMNMRYVLAVTTNEGKTYNMSMDDWMFQMDDHTILNHITMSKFGFTAGELFISFKKL